MRNIEKIEVNINQIREIHWVKPNGSLFSISRDSVAHLYCLSLVLDDIIELEAYTETGEYLSLGDVVRQCILEQQEETNLSISGI